MELIGRINHDEITAELLRLNDELNNLFLRHQRYEKNRDPQSVSAAPSAILGAAMGVPASGTSSKYFRFLFYPVGISLELFFKAKDKRIH